MVDPDRIEVRWGDFIVVKDPRIAGYQKGLVTTCWPNHVTIKMSENLGTRLKVHRDHVVSRQKGFSWQEL